MAELKILVITVIKSHVFVVNFPEVPTHIHTCVHTCYRSCTYKHT